MPNRNTIGTTSGGPVSAGPEQHLHGDHDSVAHRTRSDHSADDGSQGTVAGLKDRAAGLYQESRERVSDSVDTARDWAGDRYDAARDQVSSTVERTRD